MEDKITDEVTQLLVWIFIPIGIKYARDSYYSRKKPKIQQVQLPPDPPSRWDLIIKIFLLACSAWYFKRLATPPQNFLAELGVEVNSPAFLVRNHFRDYMMERFPGWTLLPLPDSGPSNLFDEDVYANEIRPLEELYDKLRIGKWRRWYGRFGHDAVANCKWCLNANDLSIYGASQTSMEYVIFLFIFGLGTMTPRKIRYRSWAFGVISLPFFMDCFSYAASPLELVSTLSKETQRTLFISLYVLRNVIFGLSLFVMGIWDKKRTYSDSEALHEVCKKASANVNRLVALKIARATIFSDPSLRNEFLNFYQKNNGMQTTEEDVQRRMIHVPPGEQVNTD